MCRSALKVISLAIGLVLVMPSLPWAITLEDAIEMALTEGQDARIADEEALMVKATGRQKTSFAGPQLELGASYMEMGTNAEPSPYFITPEKDYSYSAEASQLIWSGGRLIKSFQLVRSSDRLAGLTRLSGRRDVRRDVAISYHEVLFHDAALDLLRDRVAQREQELMDAEDLEIAGMVTPLDVRQARMHLNLAHEELQAALVERARSVVGFNVLLGRSAEFLIEAGESQVEAVEAQPSRLASVSPSEEALLPEGRLRRAEGMEDTLLAIEDGDLRARLLDLRLLRERLRQADLEYGMAWGARMPEVRIVGTWEKSGQEQDGLDEEWSAGVVLSMSILDGGLRRSTQARAKSQKRAAEAALQKAAKEFRGLVQTLRLDARSLDLRIGLKQEAERMAEENYADARAHYRAGTITLTRLGEFSLAYTEARFGLLELFYKEQSLLAQAKSLLK